MDWLLPFDVLLWNNAQQEIQSHVNPLQLELTCCGFPCKTTLGARVETYFRAGAESKTLGGQAYWEVEIHAIPAYKKQSYKKRLVDILWCKKRRLVDFLAVRNTFLKQPFKINGLRNDFENFPITTINKSIILYIIVQS